MRTDVAIAGGGGRVWKGGAYRVRCRSGRDYDVGAGFQTTAVCVVCGRVLRLRAQRSEREAHAGG